VDSLRWYEPDQVPRVCGSPHSQRPRRSPVPDIDFARILRRERDARLRAVPAPPHPAHARVLQAAARKGVSLEIVSFPQSTHTAQEAAHAVGAEVGQIVKSIVFVAPGASGLEPIVALVSGADRVDEARLSAVLGVPAVRRATAAEANELTGFVIGGIPPLGHDRSMRVVMDPDLGRFATVWAAAGTGHAVFEVPPATLRMLANATVAPIAAVPDPSESLRPSTGAPATDIGSGSSPGAATGA
jgi:prolyl-tRNA editing enzyme YbaK/EbsC (Cys-tRNA(Pro) deacylase)